MKALVLSLSLMASVSAFAKSGKINAQQKQWIETVAMGYLQTEGHQNFALNPTLKVLDKKPVQLTVYEIELRQNDGRKSICKAYMSDARHLEKLECPAESYAQ